MDDDAEHQDHSWALTPHVSRCCYARVLAREGAGEALVYRCSNCGSQAKGWDASVVCACGSLLADGSDAHIRCQTNEDPTQEYPGEVVAVALGSAGYGAVKAEQQAGTWLVA